MAGRVCPRRPAALGHLCHLILAVNVVSGLGHREAVLDRVRLCCSPRFWVSSAPAALGALAGPVVDLVVAAAGAMRRLCVISGLGDLADLDAHPGPAARPAGIAASGSRASSTWPSRGGPDALIGDGPGCLAAAAAGQRVVPAAPAASGTCDPRPARSRSTACGSSSSPTSTSPLASDRRFFERWSTPAAAGRPTWSSSPATWSSTTTRSTGSSRSSRRCEAGWASSRSSATTTRTTSRRRSSASWPRRLRDLEGRWTTLDARRRDHRRRRDVAPWGPASTRRRCRRPTSGSC